MGNKMTEELEVKIKDLFKGLEGKKVAIWIAGLDPDSMGSATALKHIAKQFKAESVIWSENYLAHPQNHTMKNSLDIVVHNSNDEKYDHADYDKAFCVDCVPSMLPCENIDVIIDHHPKNFDSSTLSKYEIVDIRSNAACGSIIYNWMEVLGVMDTLSDEEGAIVATSLLFAIHNDSDGLVSKELQKIDFEAYMGLHKFCDLQKLNNILNYQIPRYYLEAQAESMKPENTHILNTTYISCVGYLPKSRRDVLAQLSDNYVRLDGINTAIVFAIVDGNLEGCCRSSDVALNLHTFTQNIFGKEFSGGKLSKSAGKVPLGFLQADEHTDKNLRDKILEAVKAKVLSLIEKEVG